MTHPPKDYPQTPALKNEVIPIAFSSATWLLIAMYLSGERLSGVSLGTTTWARDRIVRVVLQHAGYIEPDDDPI